VTEGGWDRLLNRARTLGEHDGNDKPFAEGINNNQDKYTKDGDIPGNDKEYAVGVGGVDQPFDEGDDECGTLSTAPARACPERQQPSVPSR
jgi:hypothetical protein